MNDFTVLHGYLGLDPGLGALELREGDGPEQLPATLLPDEPVALHALPHRAADDFGPCSYGPSSLDQ